MECNVQFAACTWLDHIANGHAQQFIHVTSGPDSAAHQYFDNLADMAWQRPWQFLAVIGLLVSCSSLLALQLWMFVTPLRQASGQRPLLLQQLEDEEHDVDLDDARWEAKPLLKEKAEHGGSGGSRQNGSGQVSGSSYLYHLQAF